MPITAILITDESCYGFPNPTVIESLVPMHLRRRVSALWLIVAAFLMVSSARASTLEVGPDKTYQSFAAAVKDAQDGDEILISPGEYYECAIIRQNNLTIAGVGDGVVLTDTSCQGKAILVIPGNDITIRNLSLSRARVPDGNGAGIRAEGINLTIEKVRFSDNQNGILSINNPTSTITIRNSEFTRNGVCNPNCAHGIYINNAKLLRVENSRFFGTREGHHVKSRAMQTEVVNSTIEDGAEGTASYLIDVSNGGSLLVSGNRLSKGPKAENRSAAIVIGAEGATNPTKFLRVENNTFENQGDYDTMFVNNITATPAELGKNQLSGRTLPLKGDGNVDGQAPPTTFPGIKETIKEFLRSALQFADSIKIVILFAVAAGIFGGLLSLIGFCLLVFYPSALRNLILRRIK